MHRVPNLRSTATMSPWLHQASHQSSGPLWSTFPFGLQNQTSWRCCSNFPPEAREKTIPKGVMSSSCSLYAHIGETVKKNCFPWGPASNHVCNMRRFPSGPQLLQYLLALCPSTLLWDAPLRHTLHSNCIVEANKNRWTIQKAIKELGQNTIGSLNSKGDIIESGPPLLHQTSKKKASTNTCLYLLWIYSK